MKSRKVTTAIGRTVDNMDTDGSEYALASAPTPFAQRNFHKIFSMLVSAQVLHTPVHPLLVWTSFVAHVNQALAAVHRTVGTEVAGAVA